MKSALYLFVIFVLVSCSSPINSIKGRYETSHDEGREYIELKSDCTFIHAIIKKDSVTLRDSGTFIFYKSAVNKDWMLSLKGFNWYTSFVGSIDAKNEYTTVFIWDKDRLFRSYDDDLNDKTTFVKK